MSDAQNPCPECGRAMPAGWQALKLTRCPACSTQGGEAVSAFRIGERVRVVDQPSITGTVVRFDIWGKLVVLDDDRDDWADEYEEGVLVFRATELEREEVQP